MRGQAAAQRQLRGGSEAGCSGDLDPTTSYTHPCALVATLAGPHPQPFPPRRGGPQGALTTGTVAPRWLPGQSSWGARCAAAAAPRPLHTDQGSRMRIRGVRQLRRRAGGLPPLPPGVADWQMVRQGAESCLLCSWSCVEAPMRAALPALLAGRLPRAEKRVGGCGRMWAGRQQRCPADIIAFQTFSTRLFFSKKVTLEATTIPCAEECRPAAD